MKDPFEVLRSKEAEVERLRKEIEALRLVGKLLNEQKQGAKPPRGKALEPVPE